MKIPGRFDKGRLVLDPVAVAIAAQEFGAKPLVVDIEEDRPVRSLKANARYWKVLIPLVGHALNLKRPGLPPLNKNQVHYVCATSFIGQEETALGPAPCETHTLDKRQFWLYNERITEWLSSLGYHVPDGDEPVDLQDGAA